MADPCVEDTPYIHLDTEGTPAVLFATLRNPADTGSATQGDDTTHVVTDADVPHVQTRSFTIDNTAGTAPMVGVITVALNPIWAGLPDDAGLSLIWEASLTVDGVVADQRDTITTAVAEDAAVTFSPGALVGEYAVAAGDSITCSWEKRITNDGASVQWSFRMGGDKAAWTESF